MFCVRNPEGPKADLLFPQPDIADAAEPESEYVENLQKYGATQGDGIWYSGVPSYKTPMDCYIATDRLTQEQVFHEIEKYERGEREIVPREKIPVLCDPEDKEVWCCDGGPAPGGHEWTCLYWLGITYG